MTELVGIPVSVLAPSALCGLFVLLFFTGRVHSDREVTEMQTRHERELSDVKADRDVWRDNFLDQKGLMSQILVGQETTNRLLRAIPHVEDHA